jgi:hypothetical protein
MRNYAMMLYGIYFGLTTLEFIFLIIGKMPVLMHLTSALQRQVRAVSALPTQVLRHTATICKRLLRFL